MATKKNGWKRIVFGAALIVAVGGAATVLEPYAPWAPRHTFAMAAENTLDRWRTELIKLQFLVEQTKNSGDRVSQASWEKQLLKVQQKIAALVAEKVRRK